MNTHLSQTDLGGRKLQLENSPRTNWLLNSTSVYMYTVFCKSTARSQLNLLKQYYWRSISKLVQAANEVPFRGCFSTCLKKNSWLRECGGLHQLFFINMQRSHRCPWRLRSATKEHGIWSWASKQRETRGIFIRKYFAILLLFAVFSRFRCLFLVMSCGECCCFVNRED